MLDRHPDLAEHYLAIELTDPVRPTDPMRRLRERFPFALTVSWQPPSAVEGDIVRGLPSTGMSDEDLIAGFLAECRGVGPDDVETRWLALALGHARTAEVVG